MRFHKILYSVLFLAAIGSFTFLAYRIPAVNRRLAWRLDFALAYLGGVYHPVVELPTALPPPEIVVAALPQPTATQFAPPIQAATPAATLRSTAIPIPGSVTLNAPKWEKQDINNCGPATLTMYLRYYGWEGNQDDIASLLKPERGDRNVNVEELAYYVRTRAGWLNIEYRVGGRLNRLKQLLAAGIPVMVEESFYFDHPYWPNDDLWAAHYNLLTGYDDANQSFITQDSFYGSNQLVDYQKLEKYWQAFNYVYIMIYPPDQQETVKSILGEDWDINLNRQTALKLAETQTLTDPSNGFTWFNLGSNLVFFERYPEAAQAYDKAREVGLPQRMLRYQFGPFFAYFHTGRIADLMALTKYALQRTPSSEEALLWQGWGYYRQGKTKEAIENFRAALGKNPTYQDARYALDFILAQ